MTKVSNYLESIVFVAGKEIAIDDVREKLGVTKKEMDEAIAELKEKYSGECGINLLLFHGKIQFSSNPAYVEQVSEVLNPIREKELTKAMLETLAIIAYKQPITRLEVEEIRGVDCTYAVQNLSKLNDKNRRQKRRDREAAAVRHYGRVFEKVQSLGYRRAAQLRQAA